MDVACLMLVLGMGGVWLVSPVRADLMNPDFLTEKCQEGEEEVICSYKSEEPFGPRTEDECEKYANDENYYYLVSHGSSFGGEEKYCLKTAKEDNYWWIGVIVMAVAGGSLLGLSQIRKKSAK